MSDKKPLIAYSTKAKSANALELQKFLNTFDGINIKADGYPGKQTSDGVFMVLGSYLKGDPRNGNSGEQEAPAEPVGETTDTTTTPIPNGSKKRYLRLVPFFKKWEGGLSRDTKDSASSHPCPTPYDGKTGWHTNKGITYSTWMSYFGKDHDARFYAMSDEDWGVIFKERYWDKVKADEIVSDSIAFTIVSWGWGSGPVTAVKQMQRVVGVTRDGVIGTNTLKAINSEDEKVLFAKCIAAREAFFRYITDPANGTTQSQKNRYEGNKRFLNGWLNRLRSFEEKYQPA